MSVKDKPVVIGIDPGSYSAGIAIVEGEKLKMAKEVKGLLQPGWTDTELGLIMEDFMLEVQEVIEKYNPELLVVELCSVRNNMHTNKLLSYWEACAIIPAAMSNIRIERMRTKEARKRVFNNGAIKKEHAINLICDEYNINFDNDEAEAIIFALAGVKFLNDS